MPTASGLPTRACDRSSNGPTEALATNEVRRVSFTGHSAARWRSSRADSRRRALPDAGPARRLRHVRGPTRGQRRLGAGVLQPVPEAWRPSARRRHRFRGCGCVTRASRRGRRLGADADMAVDSTLVEGRAGRVVCCDAPAQRPTARALGAAGCRGDPGDGSASEVPRRQWIRSPAPARRTTCGTWDSTPSQPRRRRDAAHE